MKTPVHKPTPLDYRGPQPPEPPRPSTLLRDLLLYVVISVVILLLGAVAVLVMIRSYYR